jgi:putative effector of murein hydrolase
MLIIYVPYLLGYKAGSSTLDLLANAAVVDEAIDLYQIIRKMVLHWQQQIL